MFGPALRGGLARVESAVTTFERGLIVTLLTSMVVAVFLDALHRLFAAQEGRIERLVVALLPAALETPGRRVLAPALLALFTFGVACAALTARAAVRPPRRRLLLTAAGITGG